MGFQVFSTAIIRYQKFLWKSNPPGKGFSNYSARYIDFLFYLFFYYFGRLHSHSINPVLILCTVPFSSEKMGSTTHLVTRLVLSQFYKLFSIHHSLAPVLWCRAPKQKCWPPLMWHQMLGNSEDWLDSSEPSRSQIMK